jgi:hypothetical protein
MTNRNSTRRQNANAIKRATAKHAETSSTPSTYDALLTAIDTARNAINTTTRAKAALDLAIRAHYDADTAYRLTEHNTEAEHDAYDVFETSIEDLASAARTYTEAQINEETARQHLTTAAHTHRTSEVALAEAQSVGETSSTEGDAENDDEQDDDEPNAGTIFALGLPIR